MRRVLISLFSLFLATTVAFADDSIYEIKNISVTVPETDAMKARDMAMNLAQDQAFDQLQKKLTENGYITQQPKPGAAKVASSVKSIDVISEKFGSKDYRASYNIIFNPAQISRIFHIAKIEPVQTPNKYLVIPIVAEAGNIKIWKNEWRNLWEPLAKDNLVIPLGDLPDVQSLKTEDIANTNYEGIMRMQKRYGTNTIVLIEAEYDSIANSLAVQLERLKDNDRTIINYEYPGHQGIGAAQLYDAATKDLAYRIQNNKLTEDITVEETPPLSGVYNPQTSNNIPTAQPTRAPQTPAAPAQPYSHNAPGAGVLGGGTPVPLSPSQTPIASATETGPQKTEVIVVAPDLIAWNRIRTRLMSTPGITDLEIRSFTAGQARVTLMHNADISVISQNLSLRNLTLTNPGSGWQITEQ